MDGWTYGLLPIKTKFARTHNPSHPTPILLSLKLDLRNTSMQIMAGREEIKMQIPGPQSRPSESESLGISPGICVLSKLLCVSGLPKVRAALCQVISLLPQKPPSTRRTPPVLVKIGFHQKQWGCQCLPLCLQDSPIEICGAPGL